MLINRVMTYTPPRTRLFSNDLSHGYVFDFVFKIEKDNGSQDIKLRDARCLEIVLFMDKVALVHEQVCHRGITDLGCERDKHFIYIPPDIRLLGARKFAQTGFFSSQGREVDVGRHPPSCFHIRRPLC